MKRPRFKKIVPKGPSSEHAIVMQTYALKKSRDFKRTERDIKNIMRIINNSSHSKIKKKKGQGIRSRLLLAITLVFLLIHGVLFVPLSLHILQTKVILLLIRPRVLLDSDLGIGGRRTQILDVAVGQGILECNDELHLALDGRVETGEEARPLVLVGRLHTVSSSLGGVVDIVDLALELVADFSEETLYGGETAAQSTGFDGDFELVGVQGAGVGFEDVAGEVEFVLDAEGDLLALFGDFTTGFDVAGTVSAVLADGTPQEYLLEVRDVDLFHVDKARFRTARAFGGKTVDLAVDDLGVVSVDLRGFSSHSLRVACDTEFFVLLVGTGVVAALVLGALVERIGCDPRVTSRVVEGDHERECLAVDHLLELLNDRNKRVMQFGSLGLAQRLLAGQIVVDPCDHTLHGCHLTVALGHLDTERLELENRGITADDLAPEILVVLDVEGVHRPLFLDLAGRFDGVVAEIAVLAFEGFEDDIAEEGNTKEKELGNSLCYLLVSHCEAHL